VAIYQGKGKHRPEADELLAGVYVLDFLPCLAGLAATAAARFVRSFSQFLRSFCCLVTTAALILRFLGFGASMTFMRCLT
jgi:hypothetical protein